MFYFVAVRWCLPYLKKRHKGHLPHAWFLQTLTPVRFSAGPFLCPFILYGSFIAPKIMDCCTVHFLPILSKGFVPPVSTFLTDYSILYVRLLCLAKIISGTVKVLRVSPCTV